MKFQDEIWAAGPPFVDLKAHCGHIRNSAPSVAEGKYLNVAV
jgi:hypothetical protein